MACQMLVNTIKNCPSLAPVGVAQLTGCHPTNQNVHCSVPSGGTCSGWGSLPSQGALERQPIDISLSQKCFSPSLSPSLPLSL